MVVQEFGLRPSNWREDKKVPVHMVYARDNFHRHLEHITNPDTVTALVKEFEPTVLQILTADKSVYLTGLERAKSKIEEDKPEDRTLKLHHQDRVANSQPGIPLISILDALHWKNKRPTRNHVAALWQILSSDGIGVRLNEANQMPHFYLKSDTFNEADAISGSNLIVDAFWDEFGSLFED